MTIAALLSANGAAVPRYITIDGQTVFGPVTKTASGLVHATHGRVTPVAAHTFHGGTEATDKSSLGAWWDDEDQVARHASAMSDAFPDFAFIPPADGHGPAWVGAINTGRGVFQIRVALRRDQGLPNIRVVSNQPLGRNVAGRFHRAPHLYDSGALCVADSQDWVVASHTAATATAWAAHWLAAFTEWRFTLKWPVDGFKPDAA